MHRTSKLFKLYILIFVYHPARPGGTVVADGMTKLEIQYSVFSIQYSVSISNFLLQMFRHKPFFNHFKQKFH